MDPVLAELYGTLEAGPSQEEIEKTAQLHLLQKVAEAHDIDLNQLTDEQILEAAQELEGIDLTKQAEEEYAEITPEMVKQAELEELARNSDYGGRIFAHAMLDELRSIQKAAEEQPNPLLEAVQLEKEAYRPPSPQALGVNLSTGKKMARTGRRIAESVGHAVGKATGTQMTTQAARQAGKKALKGAGIAAAGTGAAAAGTAIPLGVVAAKKKKREAEAQADMGKEGFDEAVYARAAEHLAAAGLITDDGDVISPEDVIKTAQDIDVAALGLLEQMGYPVEWNEG